MSSIQSGTEDRYIIDGQQRITTVSLMLIAMVNAKKEGLIDADDAKLVEKIFKRYLVDEYQEDERKVKLKPIKKDMRRKKIWSVIKNVVLLHLERWQSGRMRRS